MPSDPTAAALPVEDWPTIKHRWLAFWEHGLYDRPILQVTAPRESPAPPAEDVDPETQWTGPAYMIRRTERDLVATYYGGEALPWCWNPISAGWAMLFGCQPHYSAATAYVDPAPVGLDGFPALDGWRESQAWSWTRESHVAFACASRGRFFVPVFWGNSSLDILGLVRGVEQLMMDFILNPAWLQAALRQMNDILYASFEELWPLVGQAATGLEGCVETCGFWSPGKARTFDADLAYNISPRAFRRFVLPPLVDWMGQVDHASWHLDGVGNLRHLDTLLGLPELHAVQWVQGEGPHKPILSWVPLLRQIQAHGKSLQVLCEPEEVEPLLREIRPEGLAIRTHCRTEAAARQLIERVARYYHPPRTAATPT
jgi:hypothetical protein